jgi:C-terminal processing protease CtpA/Prc
MPNSIAHTGRIALTATLAIALAACGGGASDNRGPIAGPTPDPTPVPTPTPAPPPTGACPIADQLQFADDVLNEWYLFPDLLADVDQTGFTDVQDFLDARVAPARAQRRDVGFTFATSIEEENELINSGSSAGFGIRLSYDTVNNRVFILEAFESAPGFAAGIDRGTELLAIGTNASNLEPVSQLLQTGGPSAVIQALGPSDPGVTRTIRFAQVDGTIITANIAKAEFSLDPISDRYGALILQDGGKNVGYLNLRTFIVADAVGQLRDAFQLFNANDVTELVIDFRYNGGGLVSVAEILGDLLGEGREGEVFSQTVLREEKSDLNDTELFEAEANSLRPDKIAFITTSSSASASELIINAMLPYLDEDSIALIGENTSGKPVGQFGFDLEECDLRIRAVTFRTLNANDEGEYFFGLAPIVPNTCRAEDDFRNPLGDVNEASIATALDFLAGRSCTPIAGGNGQTAQSLRPRQMLKPTRPSAAQWQIPGLF